MDGNQHKVVYDSPSTLNFFRKASIAYFSDKYGQLNSDQPNCQSRNSGGYATADVSSVRRHRQQSSHGPALSSSKSSTCLSPTRPLSPADADLLSEAEVSQVECFFRGHRTHVFVCRCLANLYLTKTDLVNGGRGSQPRSHEWQLSRTGVPVIIFDKGDTRARSKRQLQICLAERGSGFVLFKDIIDNLSSYDSHHPCFHTMYLSTDHRTMAGVSFDSELAAEEFREQMDTLISDPLNIALSAPKKSSKWVSSGQAPRQKQKMSLRRLLGGWSSSGATLPQKCQISTPCLFQHVAQVQLGDFDRLVSMSTLVGRHQEASSCSVTSSSPTPTSPTSTIPSSTASTISDDNASV